MEHDYQIMKENWRPQNRKKIIWFLDMCQTTSTLPRVESNTYKNYYINAVQYYTLDSGLAAQNVLNNQIK